MSERVHYNQHLRARHPVAKKPSPNRRIHRRLSAIATGSLLLLCATGLWIQTDRQIEASAVTTVQVPDGYYVQQRLRALQQRISLFEDRQTRHNVRVVASNDVQSSLNEIFAEYADNRTRQASSDIDELGKQLDGWTQQLSVLESKAVPQVAGGDGQSRTVQVPILIFHDAPPNFEEMLQHLIATGYTAVDLDQVAAAIRSGAALPAKPVVITLDDGFSDQMLAYRLLAKYHMKSTYYIINGGPASGWCIGASRRYDQPQPCGDSYLTWDQIREMDRDPLVTIGAHTLDHSDLASLPPADQQAEIMQSKAGIEAQLGHQIRHFAYPYGVYNQTTIDLVRAAGFSTAVSTLPGTEQSLDTIYTLHRVRDALALP